MQIYLPGNENKWTKKIKYNNIDENIYLFNEYKNGGKETTNQWKQPFA